MTTKGYSTRQSVASVTWLDREKTVETNVVGTSVLLQLFENQPAKIPGALKGALELFNHHQRSLHQSCDFSGRNFIERRKLLANRINSW